ncbi:hypothetical protein DEO72_LG11g2150 [Vigna unguiculata]|uniref:Uncharacterized protein n=1 Tax=Vigna unguiculata TaxID=3917 RepID=A0A4D6NQD9_VIGUN|nr:hypothetical protein DEO72_LG11g2150 [Vigna unguiculata]
MVVKIMTRNVRSYESTIFCILFDPAPLKIRDLQGSCWIAGVNRNSTGSGDSSDAVPSNRNGANPFQTQHHQFYISQRQQHQLRIAATTAITSFTSQRQQHFLI